jgi:hypothetical protein
MFSSQVGDMDHLSCSEKMAHPSKNEFPNRVIYRAHRRFIGPNTHQPKKSPSNAVEASVVRSG